MKERTYRIRAIVVDPDTGEAAPGLRVEAWDKDLIVDDLVGSGITDNAGRVEIHFDETHFREMFHDRRPDLFFRVYRGDQLIASTEDSVLWNIAVGEHELAIEAGTSGGPFVWGGEHAFLLVGTEAHEDTLRIESNYQKSENPLHLILPTLCITYADMAFANAIGGRQEPYPDSAAYGPKFFDPPVEILGESEVERLTWIRGAHRVVIAPTETDIEWHPRKALVIPRLRLSREKPTQAILRVTDERISVNTKLAIRVMQLADGRHIGGIRVEKAHPDWEPGPEQKEYDLWIRVIDGETQQSLPEAKLNLLRWDDGQVTPYGHGGFKLIEQRFTDGNGSIHSPHRLAGEREAVTLQMPGFHAVARCYKPLPGQRVRFHLRAWPLKPSQVRYTWKPGDTLEGLAQLTGHTAETILRLNRLSAAALKPGTRILMPCYEATYRMEPGDTYEWLARAFCYADANELAKLNGAADTEELDGAVSIQLLGWHFFYAREGDSLEAIDAMFELPLGWARTVGRVHHADRRLPYPSETIAVPTNGFVKNRSKPASSLSHRL